MREGRGLGMEYGGGRGGRWIGGYEGWCVSVGLVMKFCRACCALGRWIGGGCRGFQLPFLWGGDCWIGIVIAAVSLRWFHRRLRRPELVQNEAASTARM